MKKKITGIRQLLAVLCILVAGICYVAGRGLVQSSPPPVFTAAEQENEEESFAQMTESAAIPETVMADTASPEFIFVHVCGEVMKPGVYRMEAGSRIYEALDMAGGFTDEAASDFLNMAQILEDGMKLTVPDTESASALTALENHQTGRNTAGVSRAGTAEASAGININTATKEQLMTLPGIGEARAGDIIAYREQSGPFKKIEDIMKVSGIKEAAFQKIRESITV